MSEKRAAGHRTLEKSAPSRSPAASTQHLRLRQAARKAGQDEQTLRDLLWLINAHDQLIGLGQVARNLLLILKAAEEYRPEKVWRDEMEVFSGWPSVLEWIVETCRMDEDPAGPGNPINRHGITRHPLYATLWHRPANKRWGERYAGLQFQLLWAHASYLYRESIENDGGLTCRSNYETWDGEDMWDAFPNSPYAATRHVRALAAPGWGPLLKLLPVGRSPLEFLPGWTRLDVRWKCPRP